ncbi:hypothetical protein LPJ53_005354 [Coemansia erecta]|uniref:Cyclin N-terminal domain-containing protein n=1 Tax=Coemansia erecta TaxID=147472 RepID=A0A9W8CNW6_9FUNG|nr:hypothetical protein LPJ53_005354 [Coemansia erecta]
MLLPDTRFTIKNSAKNAFEILKRATSGVYHRVQQKFGHEIDFPMTTMSINPKYRPLYHISDMYKHTDTYASGIGQGMLRLFGPQSSMRECISQFFMEIIEDRGYSGETWAMALQILDRFLTDTTIDGVKERIYHYAFVSLTLAVEVVHAHTVSTKLFKRYVDKRCTSNTIKRFRKEVLKALMGVVSVPNVTELLVAALQIAAIKYPSAFAASDMDEQADRIQFKALSLNEMPFLFDSALVTPACQLVETVIHNQPLQRFSASELASACFYTLAKCIPNVDVSKANNCARHSYKDVEPIVNYLKTIV